MVELPFGRGLRAGAVLGALAWMAAIAGAGSGCEGAPEERPQPPLVTLPELGRLDASKVRRIDLLLAIDNAYGMGDKQALLELAVPDLVRGLVNPRCLDANGAPAQAQPSSPLEACPAGARREFEPVLDIHLGVISASIGSHGADACPDAVPESEECGPISGTNTTKNDAGHLLDRRQPCSSEVVPTWNGQKFLAWDPAGELTPPGEAILDDGMGEGLAPRLREMVTGVGEVGCGLGSQLESWYRFLVDPEPYQSLEVIDNKATPMGKDAVLLAQRAAFLRPDSLVAIVMLTDESDCSIKEYGQYFYVGQVRNGAAEVRMPRPRQDCATKGPDDPCCKSCGQSAPECGADPTCKDAAGKTALLDAAEDAVNLRCWDQKRRFGIDFLYPTDRYVKALTSYEIEDRAGNLVANPLFSDLDPDDGDLGLRDPGMVLMAGIVGVPWQDIARDKSDLGKGFKTSEELGAPLDASGQTTWDVILGDPASQVPPADPLMRASVDKRQGVNPITGDALVDATTPLGNPINGHERTIVGNDDLQYACIFDLFPDKLRTCSLGFLPACDCTASASDSPLCEPDPFNGNLPTLQVRARAHPSLRELSVLRDLGEQAVVASVCPARVTGPESADFGYRPAIDAVLERMRGALATKCLPRAVNVDGEGRVACVLLEARNAQGGACVCDPAQGRAPVTPAHDEVRLAALADPLAAQAGWDCFCEMVQLEGEALTACQTQSEEPPLASGKPVNGFCYVDATAEPPLGNVELVARCPEEAKRRFRFVGAGEPGPAATVFFHCAGE